MIVSYPICVIGNCLCKSNSKLPHPFILLCSFLFSFLLWYAFLSLKYCWLSCTAAQSIGFSGFREHLLTCRAIHRSRMGALQLHWLAKQHIKGTPQDHPWHSLPLWACHSICAPSAESQSAYSTNQPGQLPTWHRQTAQSSSYSLIACGPIKTLAVTKFHCQILPCSRHYSLAASDYEMRIS